MRRSSPLHVTRAHPAPTPAYMRTFSPAPPQVRKERRGRNRGEAPLDAPGFLPPRTTDSTPRRRLPPESVLAVYGLLLLGLPQNDVVAGVGGSVTPARLAAGLCLLWFLLARSSVRPGIALGANPVRATVLIALLLLAAADALALLDMAAGDRLSDADRSLSLLVLAVGGCLLACDGVRTARGIRQVLAGIVIGATLSALVALAESTTGFDVRPYVSLPGLVSQPLLIDNTPRDGIVRALGLTNHPIELAAVSVAALAPALHLARRAGSTRARWTWWACAAALAAAPVLSVSRTGMVGLAVVALALLPRHGARRWLAGAVVTLAGLAFAATALPGLASAVTGTVANSGTDYSIYSRLDDYGYVAENLASRPWSGQGLGTYLAPPQPFLDNQFLLIVMESGIPGLLALLGLLLVPAACALLVWRAARTGGAGGGRGRPVDDTDGLGDAGWALGVALLVTTASAASFDGLRFAQFQGLTFLLIGLAGAAYGLHRGRRPLPASTGTPS